MASDGFPAQSPPSARRRFTEHAADLQEVKTGSRLLGSGACHSPSLALSCDEGHKCLWVWRLHLSLVVTCHIEKFVIWGSFFSFFFSLQPHLQHMEVLGLGVKSELQLRLVLQPQQHWIFTPLSEARDQTRILREIASGS